MESKRMKYTHLDANYVPPVAPEAETYAPAPKIPDPNVILKRSGAAKYREYQGPDLNYVPSATEYM